jgi:hypothetical protein
VRGRFALCSDANVASLTTYEFVHGRITGPSTKFISPRDRRSRPAGHPMTRVGYPARISEDSLALLLSVHPMSADSERVFSGSRQTVSWERARLGVLSVERNECIKSWITSGLIDQDRVTSVEGPTLREIAIGGSLQHFLEDCKMY